MIYNEIRRMNVCLSINKFQGLAVLNLPARNAECCEAKAVDALQSLRYRSWVDS
jgi:hypothetical protein